MKINEEKLKFLHYFTFFSLLFSAFFAVTLFSIRVGEGVVDGNYRPLTFENGFGMGVDLVGIFTCCFFAHSIIFTSSINQKRSFRFISFICMVLACLWFDMIEWGVDGLEGSFAYTLNYIFNSLTYLANIATIALFARAIAEAFPVRKKAMRTFSILVDIYIVCIVVALVANLKTDCLFSIENNFYVDGPLALPFNIFYLILTFILGFMTIDFKKISYVDLIVILIFTLVPILGSVLSLWLVDIAFSSVALIAVVTVCFSHKHTYSEIKNVLQGEENEKNKNRLMIAQIRPHFIYNTMSSITYLCKTNPDEAAVLSERFAKYLRSNVDSIEKDSTIFIKQEIDNVVNFLEIEKVRFGERIEYSIDMQCTDFLVPALSIQPLVANSIKHGIGKKRKGGHILISTYEDDKNYYVSVEDNGVGFDKNAKQSDNATHTGISNTASRLKAQVNGRLEIDSQIGLGTTSTIIIPKGEYNE